MSEQKRALVVDDSKSARLVLRRMLEKHAIAVDTVESASKALDFLSCNRPDVIFMDHMMPGMDGFEAVKAIKSNPETATIPVMMYTSKGGDLYIGQARALGAVGVLPKTVAPVELFESLQKIGLLEERRRNDRQQDQQSGDEEDESASERAEDIARRQEVVYTPVEPVAAFTEPGMQAPAPAGSRELDQRLRSLLEEQRVEIRKDVLLSMENVARSTAGKLNRELDEKLATVQPPDLQPAANIHSNLPVILMALLLLLSLGWNYAIHTSATQPGTEASELSAAATTDIESARETISELQSSETEARTLLRASWEFAGWAMNQQLDYAFDEIALDGSRTATVESLLSRLIEAGFEGQVTLQTHAGKFCLLGDQEDGFSLPAPEMEAEKCDFIGNPVQAADTPSAHQSLGFANFLSSSPLLTDGTITVEVVSLPRDEHLAPYPDKNSATVQNWNSAARANNRVLIQLSPR